MGLRLDTLLEDGMFDSFDKLIPPGVLVLHSED